MSWVEQTALTRAGLLPAVLLAVACETAPPTTMDMLPHPDAGATLSIALTLPTLPGLTVNSGELELEHLRLISDSLDQRTEIDRITIPFSSPSNTLAFPMATVGIYSRVQAEIDHVTLQGEWQNSALILSTAGDERIVDLRGPSEELSASQAIAFTLSIDGTQWLTADLLQSAAATPAGLEIDEQLVPEVVHEIMPMIVASFALSSP